VTPDDEKRRADDILVAQLSQRFNDFIERYDRDVGAINEWRRTTDVELKTQGEILREISPAYVKGKWIVGLVALGSIGAAVKAFWAHISWHG
jgi:hypothetical protein